MAAEEKRGRKSNPPRRPPVPVEPTATRAPTDTEARTDESANGGASALEETAPPAQVATAETTGDRAAGNPSRDGERTTPAAVQVSGPPPPTKTKRRGRLFRRVTADTPQDGVPYVTFADLARLHVAWHAANRPPEPEASAFAEQYRAFVESHGEVVEAYFSARRDAAVLLTSKPKTGLRKFFGGRDTLRIYREVSYLMRDEGQHFGRLFEHHDELRIRTRLVLRGMSQRIALYRLVASMGRVLGYLDDDQRETVRKSGTEQQKQELEARDKRFVDAELKEVEDLARFYDAAAAREAKLVYLKAMALGLVLLAALAIPIGIGLGAADIAAIDLTDFFAAFIAGSLGAFVSVLTRMSSDNFEVNHEIGRAYLYVLAMVAPFIGAVSGVLVYFAIASEVVLQLAVTDPAKRFAVFVLLAFVSGFSERFMKSIIKRVEAVGAGSLEAAVRERRRQPRSDRETPGDDAGAGGGNAENPPGG